MTNSLIKEVLEGPGNAQEKLLRIYGKDLSYNNAALYMAGIKLHLDTVKRLEKNIAELSDESQEISFNKDKTQTIKKDIYLSPEESVSPVKIMQKMGFDPILWEVVTCKVTEGSWNVTMKMVDSHLEKGKVIKKSEPLTVTNKKYSVVLTVKPLVGNLSFPQILEAFKDLKPIETQKHEYNSFTSNKGLLFELPIMDFHLGKLAWAEESGVEYDLKIAEKLWRKTINDLIIKANNFGEIEEILFPIGQDFFHFDTPRVTTTAGTQLDTDTRWQKMFRKGVELLVWTIDELVKIAPIKILWIPGNHDQMLSYAAVVGIYQRYSETKNITVDLSSAPRKYILFGKNLIGYSHGEKEGKRLQGLMQVEAPELWGKSIFREFHMGHLHTEMTITNNGIIFRRISSITASDAWHAENGFLGSTRQAQAFMWHKELGLQAIFNSNVRES